jgi:hypothetical protein
MILNRKDGVPGGRDVYLVGSIPLTRPYDVFTTVAELLGDRIRRVPDGEIGDRKMWVQGQYPILAAAPGLEPGDLPEGGLTRLTGYNIPIRVKDKTAIKIAELGYARYALASYGVFRALKKAGRVPQSWKFQIGLPAPMDVMVNIEPGSRGLVEAPYERALLAELARIEAAIPHDELAITWDIVQGLLVWEDPTNKYVTLWFDDPLRGIVERFVRLGNAVAADVELGFHLCYGSQDHKHALDPRDLGACVNLANAIAKGLQRPIDYVHMPVPRERDDDAYFAPLDELDRSRVKKTYLGLLHYSDGVDGARRRMAAAERHLVDFGIATECGFGRRPSHQDIRRLIALHAEAID